MTSPAMRAWYLPMWVSSARPLQSPTAYSQPPSTPTARSWSSTSTEPAGLEADRLQAEVAGRRSPADGDEDLVGLDLAAVGERGDDRAVGAVARAPRSIATPVTTAMPSASNAARDLLAGERLLAGQQPGPALRRRSPPRRRAGGTPGPSRPRPRRRRARAAAAARSLAAVASRLSHGCASASPGIGGIDRARSRSPARPPGRRVSGAVGAVGCVDTRRRARRPAGRGREPSSMPCPRSQRQLALVVPVRWSCSPAGRTPRRRRSHRSPLRRRPGTRRAAASTSPGRISVLLGMQPQ